MKQTAPVLLALAMAAAVPGRHPCALQARRTGVVDCRRPARRSAENRPVRWLAAAAAQRTRCRGSRGERPPDDA